MQSPAIYQGTEGVATTNVPFVFRHDGWFNMTKAAQHFGKRLDKFFATEETRLFVEELARLNPTLKGEFVDAQRGRHGGTWAHPKLAVRFAQWLDVKFAVWCDAVIEDILKGKAEVVITKPAGSAVMALPQDYRGSERRHMPAPQPLGANSHRSTTEKSRCWATVRRQERPTS